ncbi:hypothetical protein D3C81_653970 [compost metagenome]
MLISVGLFLFLPVLLLFSAFHQGDPLAGFYDFRLAAGGRCLYLFQPTFHPGPVHDQQIGFSQLPDILGARLPVMRFHATGNQQFDRRKIAGDLFRKFVDRVKARLDP